MRYLDRHRATLRELFDVLGETAHHTEDDDDLVRWMERNWLGAEHGPGDRKREYDNRTHDAAWPLLQALEVVDRVDPPRRKYDHVVVMGAAAIGLHRRLELVRTCGVTAGRLSVLAGLRPHSGRARDGGLSELLAPTGRFEPAAGWRCPPRLERLAGLLAEQGVDDLVAAQVAAPSETDLARLLLRKQWPRLRLVELRVEDDNADNPQNELGAREHTWEVYSGGPADQVLLLNGRPVLRGRPGQGDVPPPRPTSRSTVREWVHGALRDDDRTVLVVVNQPHLARVSLDLRAELAELDRSEVALDFAGCEATPASDLTLLLGEIPARINAELGATGVAGDPAPGAAAGRAGGR